MIAGTALEGHTQIRFSLSEAPPTPVRLEVFDVAGRRVRNLIQESLPPGRYGATWTGDDDAGKRVGAGVYFIRLQRSDVSLVRRVVLVH